MKSAPSSKYGAAIFRLINAATAAVPAFGQGEDARMTEECCRKLLTGWTLRRWAPGVCAALLLFGWPMLGNSQTSVATGRKRDEYCCRGGEPGDEPGLRPQ